MFHKKWFHKGIVIFMAVITCLNSISPVIPAAAYAEQQVEAEISLPQNMDLAADLLDAPAGWAAYNDTVYLASLDGTATDPNGQSVHYIGSNVTTFGIGTDFSGSTSGELMDQATGSLTGVTASYTQSGGVLWRPTVTNWEGGYDTAAGTDARQTFGGIADMTGSVYYGLSAGWWIDLTFTGLDPAKEYTFATSAARCDSEYTNRLTIYTLNGADSSTNASTAGVDELAADSVRFNTGDNYYQGYVARWTDIAPGADGSFTVRAEADPSSDDGYKAYAFDVFMLKEETSTTPTPPYTLNVTVVGSGTVSKDPDQASYDQDASVTLTPVASPGWMFSGWSGDLTGSNNPETLTMDSNKSVTATFVEKPGLYTLTGHHTGNGYVTTNPLKDLYYQDESVTLTAHPDDGWMFSEWTGDLISTTNPETISMDSNKDITVVFTEKPGLYTLTGHRVGEGYVDVDPVKELYYQDESITMTAIAAPGWTFSSWDGDLTTSINPETLVMDSDKDVTVIFTQDEYSIDITIEGGGTVTPDVEGPYHYGDEVQLTASADPGYTFTGWSGDLTGSTNPETLTVDGNKAVTATFTQDEYSIDVTIVGGGTVTPDTAGPYHYGDEVQLTASADSGYTFTGWSGDLTGSTNPQTLTVDGNKAVTATFAEDIYAIDVTIVGSGTVTPDPDKSLYYDGESVTLTADPDLGYTFSGWSGDLTGSTNPETLTMDGNKAVTATFTQDEYSIDVTIVGGGSVTPDTEGPYHYGDEVQLTASADPGYTFTGWSGDLTGSTNPQTLTMDGNKAVTATFTQDEYSIDVTIVGSGSVTPDTAGPYHYGDEVQLTASADPGYTFTGWSGDLTGSINPETLTVDGNKAVTATFTQDEYSIDVTIVGGGSVTPDVAGPYHYGDEVQLTASADSGYTFSGWSGDLTGSTNPETLTMDGNKAVTATFTQDEYSIDVTIVGGGSVTPDVEGPYHYGDEVQLTASADPGYTFTGWSGDLTGSTNPQTLTMDGNKAVTATFTQNEYSIDITTVGNGTVTPDAEGPYHYGDEVQLTASAGLGYTFTGWSGDLTGSTNPETLTVDGNKAVTATFTQDEYSIDVTLVGGGSVTPDTEGPYHYGDEVQLTASADPGYTFTGWSGDLTGSTNPQTLTMDGNKAVTATFAEDIYAIDVTIVGNGTVTPDPDKTLYYDGESVTLTADPDPGYAFSGWSGDLTGSTNPVTLTMDGNKAVTATFVQVFPPTVTRVDTLAQTADGVLTEGEVTDLAITQFTVTFSEAVKDPAGDTDPDDVTNPANYQLVELGADEGLGGGDDTLLTIDAVSYAEDSFTATLEVNGSVALPIGNYALIAKGTTSIVDLEGNPLDGNGDGVEGDDFVLTFTVDIPPAKPVLETPEHQAIFNDPTPELAWNVAVNALTYDVQVDNNSDFSSPVEDMTEVADLTHTAGELADGKYFWRIRGVNQLDTAGEWSEVWYFTVDTTPPAVPVLVSPADGSVARGTPTYKWNSAVGAGLYQFRYTTSDDPDFESPVYTSPDLTVLSHLPPTQDLGTYLWQVRSGDAAGNWSDWGEARIIIINPILPSAPATVSPTHKQFIMDNTPTFVWEAVEHAITYDLQISVNNKFTNVALIELNIEDTTFTLTDSLPDGRYYWRVRGVNEVLETGPWSAVRYFDVDTVNPDAPKLKSPSDQARKTDTTPSFSWKSAAGAKFYQLEILDNELVPVLSTDYRSKTSYTVQTSEALESGRYYWHVRAQDQAGNVSAWSEARQLDISFLRLPAEGAFITDTTPQMAWFNVPNATAYRVQISTQGSDPDFETAVVLDAGDIPAGIRSYTLTEAEALAAGSYYWRLLAEIPGTGWTVLEPYGQFTVTPVPAKMVLENPANKILTNDNTPTLSWNAVEWEGLAGEVQIQVDNSNKFTSLEQELTQDTGTSIETGALPDGRYYWRARAVNDLGRAGAWSAPRYFVVDASDPAVPELTYPGDGGRTADTTPTFKWKKANGAKRYVVELRDPGGTLIWTNPATTSLAITLPAAEALAYDSSEYSWRVKAVDQAGNESEWSEYYWFLENYQRWPVDGVYTSDTTPTLKWKAVPGAEAYQLNLHREDAGDTIVDLPAGATSYTPPVLDSFGYAWTMRVQVGGEWQEWMLEDHFFVEQPLSRVILSAPATPALTQDTTPTFEWEEVVWQGAEDGWYQIQVSKNSKLKNPVVDEEVLAGSTYTPTTDLTGGRYYWRVRAVKAGGNYGPWSAKWVITIDTTAPAAPTPLKSNLGKFQSSINYKFQWSKSAGAVAYQLQAEGRAPGDWQTTLSMVVPEIEYERVTWHVRARDKAGNESEWSDWVYTDVTIMKAPTDQSYLLTGQVPFKWTTLASGRREQAQSYWLLVATDAEMTDLVFQKEFGELDTNYTLAEAEALDYGTYYWRYDACKDAGGCDLADMSDPDWEGMQPWKLVVTPKLTAPIPWYPANKITTNDNTPTLAWFTMAWSGHTGTYEIQISNTSKFKSLVHEADGIAQTSYTTSELPDGKYFWRVRAVNDLGYTGPWSTPRRLTIDAQ